MIRRVAVIALNTFKENVRDKILYNLVIFGLLLTGSAMLLSTLSIGEQARIITDIGLASINVFGILIAIFLGISLVNKELDRRTIYTIITKPVRRFEFVLGKYFGLVLTLFVNVAVMVAGFLLTLLASQIGLDPSLLKAVGLIFVELLVVTAIAVMFSTFTTVTLSAIFTLSIYVIGHLTSDLQTLGAKLPVLSRTVVNGLYYALPNLEYLNVKGQVAHHIPISVSYLLTAISYGLLYAAGLLIVACAIFQRRDFK